MTEEAHLFLAYEDGKKYAFGKLGQWHFTNSKDPCKGGMEKKITFEDAGVYTMQTQKGNLLMKEEAETSVEVLNGKLRYILRTTKQIRASLHMLIHRQSLHVLYI